MFDTSHFIPRHLCGYWPDWLVSLTVVSDIMIWLCYMILPVCMLYLVVKYNKILKHGYLICLYALFIFVSGWTHFADAVMFYHPYYHVYTALLCVVVITSVGTVVALIRSLPNIITYLEHAEVGMVRTHEAAIKALSHEIIKQEIQKLE